MIMAWCVAALAMAYTRLLPLFASDVLHGSERLYGVMLACLASARCWRR